MKSLYKYSEGVPQFINAMEAAQRKPKLAKLVINNKYLHAVALKLLLQSGEYETETREWSKLQEDKQTWEDWKTTFRAAYVAKRQSEAAREREQKNFRGSALFGVAPVGNKQPEQQEEQKMSHQILDYLEGYLDNTATAATQKAAMGTPLAELAAILAVSVDTVARQKLEIKQLTENINDLIKNGGSVTAGVPNTGRNKIKQLTEHINALRKKVGVVTAGVPNTGGNNSPNCKHCAAVGRLSPHRNNQCFFDPGKNKNRMGWATKLMDAKGIVFNDE